MYFKLAAAAMLAGVGIALALARRKRATHAGDSEPGRKRRASFAHDDGVAERTRKRREIEEVNIFAAAGGTAPVSTPTAMPDMSASWLAKTSVSMEQQADAAMMAQVYDQMAAQLLDQGLNSPAITAQRQFYGDLDKERPSPLRYADFPLPLDKGAVRLAILLPPQELCAAAANAARAVEGVLPPGMKPHATGLDSIHITLFMTSQPADPRPDPFSDFGGQSVAYPLPGSDGQSPGSPSVPGPTPQVLAAEQRAFASLAAAMPPPVLEVHSVVFATSGTLLLCFVDISGRLAGLRRSMRKAFIGGAAKQSSIFHSSLLRVLEPTQLPQEALASIRAACQQQSERLHGLRFTPEAMWHVQEWQYTTVQGERLKMPFARMQAT